MMRLLSYLLILCLLVFTPVLLAQNTLIFTSDDANLTFEYPTGWRAEVDENNVVFIFTEDTTLIVYSRVALEAYDLAEFTDPEALVETVGTSLAANEGELTQVMVGDVEAARFDFTNEDDEPVFALALPLGDELMFILAVAADGDIETATEAAMQIASTAAVPAAFPAVLEDHASEWQEAVAELEELGLIGSGGSLIFQENRAFFSGQGNWFTSLASRAPRIDIVMAGSLRFNVGSTTENETCGLMARIVVDNSGTANRYLEVGIDNEGEVFYFDLDEDTYGDDILIDDLDPDTAHHYLLLALDNTLTIYVDGQLVFREQPINERTGTYGIGLVGRGPNALCEGLDIWAYESPSFRAGVCEISVGSAVNKRSGPGTNFDLAGQLVPGTAARARARTTADDGFIWWQLDDDSWVRSDIVTVQGDCRAVPESSS